MPNKRNQRITSYAVMILLLPVKDFGKWNDTSFRWNDKAFHCYTSIGYLSIYTWNGHKKRKKKTGLEFKSEFWNKLKYICKNSLQAIIRWVDLCMLHISLHIFSPQWYVSEYKLACRERSFGANSCLLKQWPFTKTLVYAFKLDPWQ